LFLQSYLFLVGRADAFLVLFRRFTQVFYLFLRLFILFLKRLHFNF